MAIGVDELEIRWHADNGCSRRRRQPITRPLHHPRSGPGTIHIDAGTIGVRWSCAVTHPADGGATRRLFARARNGKTNKYMPVIHKPSTMTAAGRNTHNFTRA